MIAIILAAGRGERLGRLTSDIPKCLLQLGEETILDRQIRLLLQVGIRIEDIYIVAGYKAELILQKYKNVIINGLYYNTDNSYSLGLALEASSTKKDSVLVLDGDLVFDINVLYDVINSSYDNIVLVHENGSMNSTGIIQDNEHRAVEIGKHIKDNNAVYTSILKVHENCVPVLMSEALKEENKKNWYTVPLNECLSKVTFRTVKTTGTICEINDYFEYIKAKETFGIEKCKILLTGASGFLGKKIYSTLSREYNVIRLCRQQRQSYWSIDLTNPDEVYACIELNKPDIIIHTAAIADPDVCEKDKESAYIINVNTTKTLCDICKAKNIKLIFISTDYVFDGDSNDEYCSNSQRNPKNYYGYTKLIAEDLVKQLNEYLIIRIPIIYGYNDTDDKEVFLTSIINKLSNSQKLILDDVQIRYPVLVDEVAYAIQKALGEKGIIQISSATGVTKYRWAKTIAKSFNLNDKLVIPSKDVLPGNRPLHTKMNTDRMNALGIKISNVESGTTTVCRQMNCIFKLIYKSDCTNSLYGVNVGKFRFNMGKILGEILNEELVNAVDYVIPVPTSGLYYAMGLADAIGKPYLQALVKTDTSVRSFNISNIAQREDTIKSKIVPIKDLVENKSVIVVDEAIFTGTTLRIVCDMLKACNVKSIHICIPTPVSFYRCHYYIQPNRRLLSEAVDVDNLANFLRVDSVNYLPYDTFKKVLGDINKPLCYECFSNQKT